MSSVWIVDLICCPLPCHEGIVGSRSVETWNEEAGVYLWTIKTTAYPLQPVSRRCQNDPSSPLLIQWDVSFRGNWPPKTDYFVATGKLMFERIICERWHRVGITFMKFFSFLISSVDWYHKLDGSIQAISLNLITKTNGLTFDILVPMSRDNAQSNLKLELKIRSSSSVVILIRKLISNRTHAELVMSPIQMGRIMVN